MTAFVCMTLTALCDVANAAVYYDRYVCLRQLLLAQCVASTPRCCLDGPTPAGEVQLPLSLYVESSKYSESEMITSDEWSKDETSLQIIKQTKRIKRLHCSNL